MEITFGSWHEGGAFFTLSDWFGAVHLGERRPDALQAISTKQV